MQKESKKIFVLLSLSAVLLVFIIIFALIKSKSTPPAPIQNNDKPLDSAIQEPVKEQFSRVSFFLTTQNRASIALPASWEGKYRQKEADRVVSFEYIANPDLVFEIFRIKYYSNILYDKLEKNEIIIPNNKNFTYIKANTNPYVGSDRENFNNMVNRVDELIKDFK